MRLALPIDATEAHAMDEETFRAFYDRTARPVWAYLRRLTGDPAAADDLLQETYFRFLRVSRGFESDAHRLHYLFRVAASVASDSLPAAPPRVRGVRRDRRRRARPGGPRGVD